MDVKEAFEAWWRMVEMRVERFSERRHVESGIRLYMLGSLIKLLYSYKFFILGDVILKRRSIASMHLLSNVSLIIKSQNRSANDNGESQVRPHGTPLSLPNQLLLLWCDRGFKPTTWGLMKKCLFGEGLCSWGIFRIYLLNMHAILYVDCISWLGNSVCSIVITSKQCHCNSEVASRFVFCDCA